MADEVIQKVFKRKTKQIADLYTLFTMEDLKHELD